MAAKGEFPYNLRRIQRDYISRALSEQQRPKYLILDPFTMDCISVAFFRSELFQFNVFDTVSIKAVSDLSIQGIVDGVFIVKPTRDNIDLIVEILKQGPSFDSIHICSLRDIILRFHQPSPESFP